MTTQFQWLWAVAMATSLAACGGGGSDQPDSPPTVPSAPVAAADKYVGTWSPGCEPGVAPGASPTFPNGSSHWFVLTFTKVSSQDIDVSSVRNDYNSFDCSGPATVIHSSLTIKINGTATIATGVVDRLDLTEGGTPEKTIGLVQDNSIFFGLKASPRDAQGYHTVINTTRPIKKLP